MQHEAGDKCPVCALADKIGLACEGEDADDVFSALLSVLCCLIENCTDPRRTSTTAHRIIAAAAAEASRAPDHLDS